MTQNGYAYEVEIKVSRSDFFADFKKEKHKIFQAILQKRSHYCYNHGSSRHGDFICRFEYGEMAVRGYRSRKNPWESAEHFDVLNHYRDFSIRKQYETIYAPCTGIKVVKLSEINVPHRFYYATPPGLLKKEEIPEYAGLIEVHQGTYRTECRKIKEAPFIHRRPLELKHILLDKFYWECLKHRNSIRTQTIINQTSK